MGRLCERPGHEAGLSVVDAELLRRASAEECFGEDAPAESPPGMAAV